MLLYLGSIKLELIALNLTGIRNFFSIRYLPFIVFKDTVSKPVQILSRDFKHCVRPRPLHSSKYAKNRTYNGNRLFRYNASSLPVKKYIQADNEIHPLNLSIFSHLPFCIGSKCCTI